MKRLDTSEFIKRAIAKHGEKYDYSKTVYVNCSTNVCIICPEHGEFWQNPVNHYNRGDGCPMCGYGITRKSWSRSTDDFIKDATIAHNGKYDYSKVQYIRNNKNVIITCPIHGDFAQTPASHLCGSGCPECTGKKVRTTEDFIEKATKIHHGVYDYSKVKYIKTSKKVCIGCSKHGDFWQTPNSHLGGRGCPLCAERNPRSTVFGVGKNDSIKSSDPKIMRLWCEMLQRCYYPKSLAKNPSYLNCTVCEEWLTYSNFEKWVINEGEERLNKCQLDKDLLSNGIKQYSPTTCCFLPHTLNSLIRVRKPRANGLPTGVYKKSGKYITIYNKREKHLTIEAAKEAYVKAKTDIIKSAAQSAYDDGLISERAYKALMNFKII